MCIAVVLVALFPMTPLAGKEVAPQSTAHISGHAFDASTKRGIHPFRISASPADSESTFAPATTMTAPDGSYSVVIEVSKPVRCLVRCSYAANIGSCARVGTKTLDLEPGQKNELDFAARAPVTVPVRFVNADGSPSAVMRSVAVRLAGAGMNMKGVAVVGGDGRVVLEGLPPDCRFEVLGCGVTPYFGEIFAVSEPIEGKPGEELPEVVLMSGRKGGFEGIMHDAGGNGLPNRQLDCWARLKDGTLYRVRSRNADGIGRFLFVGPLAEGLYPQIFIVCRRTDAATADMALVPDVEIVAGSITDLGILTTRRLLPEEEAELLGRSWRSPSE